MVLGKLPAPGRSTVLISVGWGAYCACSRGGWVWFGHFYSHLSFHFFLPLMGWLVGCFWFNGPLRQYFSLYRAVSQREGERGGKG